MSKILIIDDESAIANLVSDALEDEGFETVICSDGNEAYDYVEAHSSEISLITLDIMMPGLSGLELCRMIRNKVDCPIIFVSAKGKTLDTVLGLEIGGDDYISKPFVVEELVARVKAHLRREQRSKDVYEDGVIKVGDIEIHTGSFEVFKNSKPIQFSTREFQLLQYLMENAGKVLTREQIFSHVWDTEFGDIGTVAVNIKSIRDKLDPNNEYIKTVWGVGYKFVKTH
ncbi:MAG: response regulator transcription factor [Oscillospiraceae bacterium]|nr:response regulator transcription factor [Oscillospiraceae bacterium]MDD7293012.1 response regulator transcription factor [Clostridiaceae bacterium]MDY5992111.1 response regulator transcription factor [Oscillospiraceae bacterium]